MSNNKSPYENIDPKELILRDLLARDRTVLANERTFLANIRTSLMLAASGITLVKLFPDQLETIGLGYLLCILSIPVFLFGYFRFLTVKRDMRRITEKLSS